MSLIKPYRGTLPDWFCTAFPKPVALYAMNEGSGSIINDLSGNTHTGTISGATWSSGKFGSAMSFANATDYVACGNPVGLSTDELTAVVGVKRPTITQEGSFFTKGAYYAYGFGFRTDASANIRVSVDSQAVISYGALPANEWAMFALSYKKDSWGKLYKNGIFTDNLNACTASIPQTKQIVIGNNYALNVGLVCKIDHAMYFNRALSASQIALLYYNPFPWFPADVNPARFYTAPPAGGLSIPVAMHHRQQQKVA